MPRGKTAKTKYREQLIFAWAEEHHPVTVRQLFYRLSTLESVPKDDSGYNSVQRVCANMRRDGELPYAWIADNTRWVRRARTFHSLEDALRTTAITYRRTLWESQPCRVEIWLEKDALAGVIMDIIETWDVPLMVVKGYPSLSFLHTAAEEIQKATENAKKTQIFYFGDYDPSGKDIPRVIKRDIHKMAPRADFEVKEVAVTEQQITDWDLPSRTTKKTDSRSKNFSGKSVELDAISPADLRQLVEESIASLADPYELEMTKKIEKAERESIFHIIDGYV